MFRGICMGPGPPTKLGGRLRQGDIDWWVARTLVRVSERAG